MLEEFQSMQVWENMNRDPEAEMLRSDALGHAYNSWNNSTKWT